MHDWELNWQYLPHITAKFFFSHIISMIFCQDICQLPHILYAIIPLLLSNFEAIAIAMKAHFS